MSAGLPRRAGDAEFTIRPAAADDYGGLCALFAEADALHQERRPDIFQRVAGPARGREYVMGLLASDEVAVFVAEMGEELAGVVVIALRTPRDVPILTPRRYAMVDTLAVRQDARRRGIGRALMARAHEWAADEGAESVELNVWAFNEGAVRFYEALGYRTDCLRMSQALATNG